MLKMLNEFVLKNFRKNSNSKYACQITIIFCIVDDKIIVYDLIKLQNVTLK